MARLLHRWWVSAWLGLCGLTIVAATFSPVHALVACTCKNIGGGFCTLPSFCFRPDAMNKTIKKDAQELIIIFNKEITDDLASAKKSTASSSPLKILETGYSQLPALGGEGAGYGLYSYAIVTSHSERSSAFLAEVFKAIPPESQTAASRNRLNIFYVPIQKDKQADYAASIAARNQSPVEFGKKYSEFLYDYTMARAILNRICSNPQGKMRELCQHDLLGPYIFTYTKPATSLESLEPPFLFVDLTDVRARAFAEFISAFRSQVKSDDIADRQKIDTLRLGP